MYSDQVYVDIGYCLAVEEGGFAFQPPRTVMSHRDKPLGLRAIQNCPAVNSIERQLVEIPSPVGIRLTLKGGKLEVNPQGTFVQPEQIDRWVTLEPQDRWRHPKKPVIQLRLPFFFVTDERVMMSVLPPFLDAHMRRWPGTVVAGRMPVTDWPQDLAWGFEWDRPDEELVLKQGEVLAYTMFEFDHPNKRPRLVEAELTPELDEFRQGMQGVHHLTPDIEALWESARTRRPARLLVPLA